jgi:Zn-dependent M28 family amino/carboxypeptidase
MLLVNNYEQSADFQNAVTIGPEYFDEDFPSIFVNRDLVEVAVPDLESWSDTINLTNSPNSQDTGVTATIDLAIGVVQIEADNLLGAVEGTDPDIGDEVVVVGAHLDYAGVDPNNGDIFTGCDDNASGTAVMMELARAMAAHESAPARTVLFAAWNGGQWSQSGSCHYVDNPTLALGDTVAAFSVDMVGSGDATGVGVYGATLPENAWLAEVIQGSAAEMGLTWQAQMGEPYELSDHICFTENAVPGVMVSTLGPHGAVNTPQDTITFILPGDLEAAVWMMWAGLLPVAMGEEGDYTSKAIP